MRSPSSRILINSCDIYAAVPAQDADGGPAYAYPAVTRPGVACSAQPVHVDEVFDQDRLIRETTWEVMFGAPTGVKNRDKLVITAPDGTQHTAFAKVEQDQAGRGAAYVVYAIERA